MSTKVNQTVKDRINQIAQDNGGRITPDLVVADAQNPDSPLHRLFEWDTEKAAHQHWLKTARSIIRQVKIQVTVDSKQVNVVAYVRDPKQKPDEQGYVSLLQAASDEDERLGVIAYELGRAEAALQRVLSIGEALQAGDQVRAALAHVVSVKAELDQQRGRKAVAA